MRTKRVIYYNKANINTRLIKRITRIAWIIDRLNTGHRIFCREVALKFGADIRNIQRDMNTIEQAGVPVFNKPVRARACWYWKKV